MAAPEPSRDFVMLLKLGRDCLWLFLNSAVSISFSLRWDVTVSMLLELGRDCFVLIELGHDCVCVPWAVT